MKLDKDKNTCCLLLVSGHVGIFAICNRVIKGEAILFNARFRHSLRARLITVEKGRDLTFLLIFDDTEVESSKSKHHELPRSSDS